MHPAPVALGPIAIARRHLVLEQRAQRLQVVVRVGRYTLSETDDGEWIDMVYWESLDAAKASGAKFGEEMGACCEPLIDMTSVVVSHSKAHVMQRG